MTQPADVVRSLFAHHLWATETLIDHLAGLPAERLDEAIPGTYGSMVATLTHLVDDGRYLVRFEDPPRPRGRSDGHPLPTLRAEAEHRARWQQLLDRLDDGRLSASVRAKPSYPDTDDAEGLLLLQAIHHGNDHRRADLLHARRSGSRYRSSTAGSTGRRAEREAR